MSRKFNFLLSLVKYRVTIVVNEACTSYQLGKPCPDLLSRSQGSKKGKNTCTHYFAKSLIDMDGIMYHAAVTFQSDELLDLMCVISWTSSLAAWWVGSALSWRQPSPCAPACGCLSPTLSTMPQCKDMCLLSLLPLSSLVVSESFFQWNGSLRLLGHAVVE